MFIISLVHFLVHFTSLSILTIGPENYRETFLADPYWIRQKNMDPEADPDPGKINNNCNFFLR